jgi:hypothetical protein
MHTSANAPQRGLCSPGTGADALWSVLLLVSRDVLVSVVVLVSGVVLWSGDVPVS